LIGKYYPADQHGSLHDAVSSLLQTFSSALEMHDGGSYLAKDMQRAEQDFTTLYRKYLDDPNNLELNDIVFAPDTRLHTESGIATELGSGIEEEHKQQIKLESKRLSKPWRDKCTICDGNLKDDDSTIRCCWNCGIFVHSQCCANGAISPPSHSLEQVTLSTTLYGRGGITLENVEQPDFVKRPSPWMHKVIKLVRNHRISDSALGGSSCNKVDREYPDWGLIMFHSEETKEALDKASLSLRTASSVIPLRIPHEGLIVQRVVLGSIAEKCGVQHGDVVVGVKYPVPIDPNSDPSIHSYDLAGMKPDICRRIFSMSAPSMFLEIERPTAAIIQIAQEYDKKLRASQSEAAADYADLKKSQWYCDGCRLPKSTARLSQEEDVINSAKLCSAVIRRLGMEWCSLPFHDESRNYEGNDKKIEPSKGDCTGVNSYNIVGDGMDIINKRARGEKRILDDEKNTSLRRLDQMMETIINREKIHCQDKSTPIQNKNKYNPFYSNEGKRLEWAGGDIESRPFDLLLKGVSLMVNPHTNKDGTFDKLEDHRLEMRKRFVILYVAWCLDFRGTKSGTCITVGPPLCALKSIKPWIADSCCVCYRPSSSVDDQSLLSPVGVCNRQKCKNIYRLHHERKSGDKRTANRLSKSNSGPKCDAQEQNTTPFDDIVSRDILIDYDFHSSLVGTMILVLPTDPIIQALATALQFPIGHGGRLCEFVVASYLPYDFISTKQLEAERLVRARSIDDKKAAKHGLFYLIPILNENQLTYVFNLCKMRNPSNKKSKKKWVDLKIFQLEGIIELTPEELLVRISSTASINTAINNEVATLSIKDNQYKLDDRSKPDTPMIDLYYFEQMSLGLNDSQYLWQMYFNLPSLLLVESSRYVTLMSLLVDLLYYLDMTFGRSLIKRDTGKKSNYCLNISENIAATDAEASDSEFDAKSRSKMNKYDGWNVENSHDSPSKNRKGIGGKHCHILQGMVSFQESDAAKSLTCTVCYTDLLYWFSNRSQKGRTSSKISVNYMKLLEKMIIKEPLLIPRTFIGNLRRLTGSASPDVHTVILHRLTPDFNNESEEEEEEGDEEYKEEEEEELKRSTRVRFTGKGWGFELVRWSKEEKGSIVRVGRVVPHSPASQGGLCSHDIVLSINGRAIGSFASDFILAKEILNFQEVRSVPRAMAKQFPSASVLYHMKVASEGPVIVEVHRMENPTDHTVQEKSQFNFKSTSHPNALYKGVQIQSKQIVKGSICPVPTQSSSCQADQISVRESTHQHQHTQQTFAAVPQRPIHPPHSTHIPDNHNESGSLSSRRQLSARHLYLPGIADSFLSLCEASILVEAVHRKSPFLGMRLLCPRYDTSKIREEYESTICPHVNKFGYDAIPQLTEDQWSFILAADYKRSEHESGPVAFNENGYTYHMPTGKLPLDRLLEHFHKRQTPHTPIAPPIPIAIPIPIAPPIPLIPHAHPPSHPPPHQHPPPHPPPHQHPPPHPPPHQHQHQHQQHHLPLQHHQQHHPPPQHQPHQPHQPHQQQQHHIPPQHQQHHPPQHQQHYPPQPIHQQPIHQQPPTTSYGPGQGPVPVTVPQTGYDSFVNEDPTYRIRGGGDTEEQEKSFFQLPEFKIALSYMRVNQWSGTTVFGEYKNGKKANYFVGKVKSPVAHKHDKKLFSEALVDVFYRSSVGYLRSYQTSTFPHCDLFVVESGDAMKVTTKWFEQYHMNKDQVLMLDDQVHGLKANLHADDVTTSLNNAARILLHKMQQQISGSVNLGFLPDGNTIHWFISDPTSLYIRASITSADGEGSIPRERLSRSRLHMLQSKYKADIIKSQSLFSQRADVPVDINYLHPCQTGMFCCVWGCSTIENSGNELGGKRTMLAFSYEKDLINHLDQYHGYDSISAPINFNGFRWNRISEGPQINRLCAMLTSSICARQPQLIDTTQHMFDDKLINNDFSLSPSEKTCIFNPAKFLQLTHSKSGAPEFSPLRSKFPTNRTTRRLISLCSKIARLFTIERDGKFRLGKSYFCHTKTTVEKSSKIIDSCPIVSENKLLSQVEDNISAITNDNCHVRKEEISPTFSNLPCPVYNCRYLSTDKSKVHCLLCSTSSEGMIQSKEIDADSDKSRSKHGVGCGIACELCFKKCNNPYRSTLLKVADTLTPIQGQLGAVKLLMIKVAANIPPSLFPSVSKSSSKHMMPLLDHEIWTDLNINVWVQFATQCVNCRMIAQAYVVLLCSINKKRMPSWWKSNRSGWASTYAIMNMPTLSKLALHLHTLDLAIAQFIANRTDTQHKPLKKHASHKKGKHEDKMIEVTLHKQGEERMDLPIDQRKKSKLPAELQNMGIKQRMETVIRLARQAAIPLHDGITDDDCYICDNGGFVLCCEFCVNVAHPECLGYKGKKEDIDWDFVCEECAHDIYNACHKIDKDKGVARTI